ncbi:MAG TPA: Holliday junction branch migration DNA helicase RuvB, partial [Firmicutes bacterium]|nr:Holliday junction branch migration DNA helicase RuvB [Bacillota bacterium]
MEEERLMAPAELSEDGEIERTLRPRRLDEYIGQTRIKENMQVYIEAAKGRREA